jgi:integrase
VRSDYIEREALSVLFAAMTRENVLAVRVSLQTGLRIGDVLALTPECLGEDGSINTVCQKTGKPFHGYVDKQTAKALRWSSNKKWLFPSPKDGNNHRTRQAVWRNIKDAVKRCGVRRNVTPHTARKIYAVETFRKKGLDGVQKDLQHDRITTSMLYAFADTLTIDAERRSAQTQASDATALAFCRGLVAALGGEAAIFAAAERALREVDENACLQSTKKAGGV